MKQHLIIDPPSVIDLIETQQMGGAYYVSKEQPMSIFKAVEQLAKYFKREGDFSFLQYCANEQKTKGRTDAYIWIDKDWNDKFAVGACAFSQMKDVGESGEWAMQWVWFHPYYRNKGLLSEAWPFFVEKYGKDFKTEPPLSKHMISLLKKLHHKYEENIDD